MVGRLKYRTYQILELSVPGDTWGDWADKFMIGLISTNIVAIVLETVPSLAAQYGRWFLAFDAFSVLVFTVEYILRVWSCTIDASHEYRHPIYGRLRYMATPLAIVDLLSFLPFYFGMFIVIDLRMLRVFRLIRLLKLTRYSPALQIIGRVMRNQARALGAAMFIMLVALVFSSSLIYVVEHRAQPDVFTSIPEAMWWAIATLTTVGYGDVTPVTALGKVLGGITMVMGIGMFALPTAVIASGFSQEIRRHEFIVNWRLVAEVPLFSELGAAHIAEIVNLLNPILVPPRHAVVRIGEPGDSMFFVISGELEIELPTGSGRLGAGDFFGEIGLLQNSVRVANVLSLTECQLLQLTAEDFWRLIEIHPELGDEVRRIMESRLSESIDTTTRTVSG